ncbi:Protein T10B5.10 [Aphelenchoides avenae]|nr:Protein T10B5.10 [Aphelenchus avenae]
MSLNSEDGSTAGSSNYKNAGRKKSNPAWEFFVDLREKGFTGVRCRFCGYYSTDRSPTGMRFHIKRNHDTGVGGLWHLLEEKYKLQTPHKYTTRKSGTSTPTASSSQGGMTATEAALLSLGPSLHAMPGPSSVAMPSVVSQPVPNIIPRKRGRPPKYPQPSVSQYTPLPALKIKPIQPPPQFPAPQTMITTGGVSYAQINGLSSNDRANLIKALGLDPSADVLTIAQALQLTAGASTSATTSVATAPGPSVKNELPTNIPSEQPVMMSKMECADGSSPANDEEEDEEENTEDANPDDEDMDADEAEDKGETAAETSEQQATEADDDIAEAARRPRNTNVWTHLGTFTNEQDMVSIRSREKVSKRRTEQLRNGTKVRYRCNKWKVS